MGSVHQQIPLCPSRSFIANVFLEQEHNQTLWVDGDTQDISFWCFPFRWPRKGLTWPVVVRPLLIHKLFIHADSMKGIEGLKLWNLKSRRQLPAPQQSCEQRGQVSCSIWITWQNEQRKILCFGTGLGYLVFWLEGEPGVSELNMQYILSDIHIGRLCGTLLETHGNWGRDHLSLLGFTQWERLSLDRPRYKGHDCPSLDVRHS